LNPGSFAIVQLYHIKDVGDPDEPVAYRTRWDIDFVADDFGDVGPKRVYRGPIFNRHGGTVPDWDPLFRKPVYVANLEDYGFSAEQVKSGEFLVTLKEWLTPIKRRIVESAREQGRVLQRATEDIADEATDFLWREAQKSDATSVIMANKHAKEGMAELERAKERGASLPSYYMPPGV
jgi:hypothetical protein